MEKKGFGSSVWSFSITESHNKRPVQLDTIVLQGLKDELQVANPEFSTDSLRKDVERSLGEFDTGESIEAPNAKVISLAEKVGNSWEVMEWMVVKCGENGVEDVGIWIELVKFV